MKYFLLGLTVLLVNSLIAQEDFVPLQISAQGNTIRANYISNEAVDTLFLKMNKKETGKLVILNVNVKAEDDIKRDYFITNEKDNQPLKLMFLSRVVGISNISLKQIFNQVVKGDVYNLYTSVLSVEDNSKVQNILLCKIVIR
ncbi:MAG: hypothetical protein LC122_09675 [Chitinophagales bacterium]|nr:hypothetical protein [Chitinophagales bacterium]